MKKLKTYIITIFTMGILIPSLNCLASAFTATFQNNGNQPIYMTETNYSCMHSNNPPFPNNTNNPYTNQPSTLIAAKSSISTIMKENLVECSEAKPQFNFWYEGGSTYCNIHFSWSADKTVSCNGSVATGVLVPSSGPSDDVTFTVTPPT